MLESIKFTYHHIFGVKMSIFLPSFTQGYNGRHYVTG